jgi:integrase
VDENVDRITVARFIGRLTELQVQRAKHGWHNDGGGLYLRIEVKPDKDGKDRKSRWWVYRYGAGGKRYHGLGPAHTISLAEAREQARRCRKLLLEGADPIATGKARRAAVKLAQANAKTLQECADAYHEAHRAAWANAKHVKEWRASLEHHVFPVIGDLSVAEVSVGHVLSVLEPIWTTKPETASRLRARLEVVLDWAKARGLREGENPARWRGHLVNLLPRIGKAARVKHHAALPYGDIPAFMAKLRQREGSEARTLQFAVLTAARAGEVCGATWDEVDPITQTWTVPRERMKGRRAHRVPLAPAARVILEQTAPEQRHGYIFFPDASRRGKPVTVIALWRLTQELTGGTATTHGFRSTFKDWASEQTAFPREVIEMALAHRVGDDTEQAYLRGDLLKKRRHLMEAWAAFVSTPAQVSGSVTPIGRRTRG